MISIHKLLIRKPFDFSIGGPYQPSQVRREVT